MEYIGCIVSFLLVHIGMNDFIKKTASTSAAQSATRPAIGHVWPLQVHIVLFLNVLPAGIFPSVARAKKSGNRKLIYS